jgi:cytochrome c553
MPFMKRVSTKHAALAAGLIAVVLPALAGAFATARQELDAALRSKPNLDHGAELFRNCAVCHGPQGAGTRDGGVPRIAGQHVSVLAKQLVDYRHDRRWDIRMEHFADKHHLVDAQAIADVTAYVHQLTVDTQPGVGDGELAAHGANVYGRRCESCHGESAQGNSKKMIPRIAGQHYDYLMRQIYDAVDGRRPNFSPVHIRMLATLDRSDIVGLADYLSRLDPNQKPDAPVPTAAP